MESFLNIIAEYKAYGLLAILITVFATPFAAQIAKRFGVLDIPDQDLKPHVKPTPYLGGAAICLGWCAAVVAGLVMIDGLQWRVIVPVLLGGVAMSTIGLVDDMREIPPKLRLGLGALIIVTVMVFIHFNSEGGLRLTDSFFSLMGIKLPALVALPLSFLLGLFIVLGACNSTNLIDGLDGLCAGVTAIISLGFFVLASYLAIHEYSRDLNSGRLVMAVAILGATLGFLPFNSNPARIFMGDAGSVLLGYNCGMMILLFDERGQLRWMLGGLMIFALPIFDTALAIVRRWRSGRSIFEGDRSHFYDQLIDRGMSVRKVVLISYALAAIYAVLGCVPIWLRLRYTLILYVIVVLLTILAIVSAGMAHPEPAPQQSKPPPKT